MISPSWNGPRTHLFDAPVVTTDVANHSSVHCVGPTRRRSQQFDLRGLELRSDCVVEMMTNTLCESCKVIATTVCDCFIPNDSWRVLRRQVEYGYAEFRWTADAFEEQEQCLFSPQSYGTAVFGDNCRSGVGDSAAT